MSNCPNCDGRLIPQTASWVPHVGLNLMDDLEIQKCQNCHEEVAVYTYFVTENNIVFYPHVELKPASRAKIQNVLSNSGRERKIEVIVN